jgi:hypothetical protein
VVHADRLAAARRKQTAALVDPIVRALAAHNQKKTRTLLPTLTQRQWEHVWRCWYAVRRSPSALPPEARCCAVQAFTNLCIDERRYLPRSDPLTFQTERELDLLFFYRDVRTLLELCFVPPPPPGAVAATASAEAAPTKRADPTPSSHDSSPPSSPARAPLVAAADKAGARAPLTVPWAPPPIWVCDRPNPVPLFGLHRVPDPAFALDDRAGCTCAEAYVDLCCVCQLKMFRPDARFLVFGGRGVESPPHVGTLVARDPAAVCGHHLHLSCFRALTPSVAAIAAFCCPLCRQSAVFDARFL